MASTIYFNGRLTSVPGSYSEVDASGLAVVGLGATGIIACLGEAEGGAPFTVGIEEHRISNPSKVGRTFRGGDLVEAGQILFSPSKDPGIPAGAQEVVFVKVNPSTQSSKTFQDGDGNDVLTVTSADWGLFTTRINVMVEAGTDTGYLVTISLDDDEEVLDNIGGSGIFSLAYTPGSDGADTMTVTIDPGTGVTAAFTWANAGLDVDYVGTLSLGLGLDAVKLAAIVAGHTVQVISSSAGDTTQSVTVYGVDNGTSLPTSEVLALNGTSAVTGAVTWATVHGFTLSAAAAGSVTVRDTTGPVVLYTAPPAALSRGVRVFTEAVEAASMIASLVANGASVQKLIVIGVNHTATPTLELVTLTGAVAVNTATRWTSISAVAMGYVEAARTITLEGTLLDVGDALTLTSSNAGDTTQTVTIYGLDSVGEAQTETIALNGVANVSGVATWSKVLGAAVSAAHLGTISIGAPTETVVLFSILTGDLYAGFVPVDRTAVAGTAVTLVLSGATTPNRDVLVVGLDANGSAQAEKFTTNGTTPVAGALLWSEITGLCVGHVPVATTVTLSGSAFSLPVAGYATVGVAMARINSLEGWVATGLSQDAETFASEDLDAATAVNVRSVVATFGGDLQQLVDAINAGSAIITAERATGGEAGPAYTATPVFLTGGVEGTTLFSHWQAALDALKGIRVNTVVPLTDDEAVHAAAVAHASYMCGAGRSERDVVLGAESGMDLDDLKARSLALNTRHARLEVQDVVRFNTEGVREQFPPMFTACLAAGMQSGAPIGEPLTAKFIDALDVVGNDADWTVVDDADELIQSGLNVIEKVPNRGFRWLRGVTTYQIDDNLAYVEASTNNAVNFAIFEFRTEMEFAIGRVGFAGTVNAVMEVAIQKLGVLIDSGAIVEWRSLVIELAADVITIDVEVAPAVPVNFVKNTIHLVQASAIRLAA